MHSGTHFQGLEQAARAVIANPALKKRLVNLVIAYNLVRHISEVSSRTLVAKLEAALSGEQFDIDSATSEEDFEDGTAKATTAGSQTAHELN